MPARTTLSASTIRHPRTPCVELRSPCTDRNSIEERPGDRGEPLCTDVPPRLAASDGGVRGAPGSCIHSGYRTSDLEMGLDFAKPPRAPPTSPPRTTLPTQPAGDTNDDQSPVTAPTATFPAAEPTTPAPAPRNAPRPVRPHDSLPLIADYRRPRRRSQKNLQSRNIFHCHQPHLPQHEAPQSTMPDQPVASPPHPPRIAMSSPTGHRPIPTTVAAVHHSSRSGAGSDRPPHSVPMHSARTASIPRSPRRHRPCRPEHRAPLRRRAGEPTAARSLPGTPNRLTHKDTPTGEYSTPR
ncbi:hypothetical protein NONI108955_06300 [Nocardia ninae]